jgi:hypothetical protein
MWFVLHPSCKILNRYATEKQEKKILKNKNDEDKVAEITTEGESEEATEQPNKSKENRKRNATINKRDTEMAEEEECAREREIFAAKKNKTFPTGHAEFLYTYLPVTVCPVDPVGKTAARRPISFLGNYLNIGRYLVHIYLPTYRSPFYQTVFTFYYHSSNRLPPPALEA